MEKVSLTEVENFLTPDVVKIMRILYLIIMAGASSFLLFIIFMYFKNNQNIKINDQIINSVNLFSIIHGILFLLSLWLSGFINYTFFYQHSVAAKIKKMKINKSTNLAVAYFGIIQKSKIINMAILQLPVVFGFVTCLLSIINNVIYYYPYYWLNLLSYLTFMFLLIKDFPSKDKLLKIFKTKMNYLLE